MWMSEPSFFISPRQKKKPQEQSYSNAAIEMQKIQFDIKNMRQEGDKVYVTCMIH